MTILKKRQHSAIWNGTLDGTGASNIMAEPGPLTGGKTAAWASVNLIIVSLSNYGGDDPWGICYTIENQLYLILGYIGSSSF